MIMYWGPGPITTGPIGHWTHLAVPLNTEGGMRTCDRIVPLVFQSLATCLRINPRGQWHSARSQDVHSNSNTDYSMRTRACALTVLPLQRRHKSAQR